MGDVQLYNVELTAAQVSQLYLNDSVIAKSPTDAWPLSGGFQGSMNQSADTYNSLNQIYFRNSKKICTNADAINNLCGAQFTQP
jgi:hypothetical protein